MQPTNVYPVCTRVGPICAVSRVLLGRTPAEGFSPTSARGIYFRPKIATVHSVNSIFTISKEICENKLRIFFGNSKCAQFVLEIQSPKNEHEKTRIRSQSDPPEIRIGHAQNHICSGSDTPQQAGSETPPAARSVRCYY